MIASLVPTNGENRICMPLGFIDSIGFINKI